MVVFNDCNDEESNDTPPSVDMFPVVTVYGVCTCTIHRNHDQYLTISIHKSIRIPAKLFTSLQSTACIKLVIRGKYFYANRQHLRLRNSFKCVGGTNYKTCFKPSRDK